MFSIGILEDKGGKGLFAYVKSGSHRSRGWFVTDALVEMSLLLLVISDSG